MQRSEIQGEPFTETNCTRSHDKEQPNTILEKELESISLPLYIPAQAGTRHNPGNQHRLEFSSARHSGASLEITSTRHSGAGLETASTRHSGAGRKIASARHSGAGRNPEQDW